MTRVLEINFSSSDPDFAALFANTMAREYIAQSVELRSANADDTNAWLSQNVDDLKLKLEKAETRLQAYAKSTNLIYTSNRESVAEQKLKQLQDELSKAQADRVVKQSRFELTTNAPSNRFRTKSATRTFAICRPRSRNCAVRPRTWGQ